MKTYSVSSKDITRDWFVVDASGKILGRLASDIATRLKGKHKPEYSTHIDVGDYIIVINASKIAVSGSKLEKKSLPPTFRLPRRAKIYDFINSYQRETYQGR